MSEWEAVGVAFPLSRLWMGLGGVVVNMCHRYWKALGSNPSHVLSFLFRAVL